jgi:predicted nucleic acid-binding protein
MSYLIDTDLLSFLRRKGRSRKLERFVAAHEAEIFVSVVTWAEIEAGVASTTEAFQEELRPWITSVRRQFAAATEPLDEAVLVRWKQLLFELKAKNRTVACEDSLIAATALHANHTILTRNTTHFAPTGAAVLNPIA